MEGTIGEIKMFGGNFAPRSWALCEGQLLSISANTALFSILGTTFGGDGRTTFALPDMRGRVPMGPGTGPGLSPRRLGEKGGTETDTLTVAQLPAHNHAASGNLANAQATPQALADAGTSEDPTGAFMAASSSGDKIFASNQDANMAPVPVSGSVQITVANTGGNQPINNVQPYLAVNFIICLQGIFPSRS